MLVMELYVLTIGRMPIMNVGINVSLKTALILAKKHLDEKDFRDHRSRFVVEWECLCK